MLVEVRETDLEEGVLIGNVIVKEQDGEKKGKDENVESLKRKTKKELRRKKRGKGQGHLENLGLQLHPEGQGHQ